MLQCWKWALAEIGSKPRVEVSNIKANPKVIRRRYLKKSSYDTERTMPERRPGYESKPNEPPSELQVVNNAGQSDRRWMQLY